MKAVSFHAMLVEIEIVQKFVKLIGLFCFAKVVCDAYTPAGEPIPTNKRHRAAEIFSNPKVEAEIPWYVLHCLSS